LYGARFPEEDHASKDAVWQVLCERFFQEMIRPSDAVLDLGAGYGEFLRHTACGRKLAVEINEEAARHIPPDVEVLTSEAWQIDGIDDGSVDVVFASNFFEHLPDKEKLLQTLEEVHRVLTPGGRLLILQPNLALLHGRFFDFLDHHLPLTHASMCEALTLCGFEIVRCVPRFLPFTTRSRLPQAPWMVRAYLGFPPAWWLLGRQMFIRADKGR